MIYTAMCKIIPHKVMRTAHARFTFDVLERAYLMHWALEIPTTIAVGFAFGVTLLVMWIFVEE